MDILQWLSRLWAANRETIMISLVTGAIFFTLGPIGLWFSGRRIRQERVKKAKDSLLDLLEGMLVGGQEVNADKLGTLLRAVERDVDVTLEPDYDLAALLDDVGLRFTKSKHLDATQKDEYFKTVRQLTNGIRGEEQKRRIEPVPAAYSEIMTKLRAAIANNDQEVANGLVDELQEGFVPLERREAFVLRPFLRSMRLRSENPRAFAMAALVTIVVYALVIIFLSRSGS